MSIQIESMLILNRGKIFKFTSSFYEFHHVTYHHRCLTLSLWLIIKCRFSVSGELNRKSDTKYVHFSHPCAIKQSNRQEFFETTINKYVYVNILHNNLFIYLK